VIFLAFRQRCAEPVFRRQDFATKQHGFGRIGAIKYGRGDYVWHQIPGGGQTHRYFRGGLEAQLAEQKRNRELDQPMQRRGPWLGAKFPFPVFAVGFGDIKEALAFAASLALA